MTCGLLQDSEETVKTARYDLVVVGSHQTSTCWIDHKMPGAFRQELPLNEYTDPVKFQ